MKFLVFNNTWETYSHSKPSVRRATQSAQKLAHAPQPSRSPLSSAFVSRRVKKPARRVCRMQISDQHGSCLNQCLAVTLAQGQ